mmetsp:Transcript_91799/g.127452  ORF Transcript_91799/g.127452 Transcript_91799/m.127452 type:complete len:256 (+) Transcript_91799:1087-1854(+)
MSFRSGTSDSQLKRLPCALINSSRKATRVSTAAVILRPSSHIPRLSCSSPKAVSMMFPTVSLPPPPAEPSQLQKFQRGSALSMIATLRKKCTGKCQQSQMLLRTCSKVHPYLVASSCRSFLICRPSSSSSKVPVWRGSHSQSFFTTSGAPGGGHHGSKRQAILLRRRSAGVARRARPRVKSYTMPSWKRSLKRACSESKGGSRGASSSCSITGSTSDLASLPSSSKPRPGRTREICEARRSLCNTPHAPSSILYI